MRKVFLIPDTTKIEAYKVSLEVERYLRDHLVLPLWSLEGFTGCELEPCEFATLLGGDGFIMRKSLEVGRAGIPFVAINFGEKGFLAVAEKDNWQEVLEKVLNGRYVI